MATTEATRRITPFHEKGPIAKTAHVIWFVVKTLLIALLLSIVIEFIVIKFWYPEQGADHSAQLLVNEIDYLSDNFKSKVFYAQTTAGVTIDVANQVYAWVFVATGFEAFNRRYSAPIQASEGTTVRTIKRVYRSVRPYALASVNIMQLFCVRLVVILMSLPAFLLISYAAIVDGLVHRDLRRYTGAIERSWVHHFTKSWLRAPTVVIPAMVYLALPFNAPPSLIFMPSFVFFGLLIFILITTYKKFI